MDSLLVNSTTIVAFSVSDHSVGSARSSSGGSTTGQGLPCGQDTAHRHSETGTGPAV